MRIRRFDVRFGALLIVFAIFAAGCVSIPTERSANGDAWVPVDQKRAEAFLKHHDDALADATDDRDPKLAETVLGGSASERRAASFAISKAQDPNYDEPIEKWRHTEPVIFVPALEDYPIRVVTMSTMVREGKDSSDGKWVNLGVVRRSNASSPWKKIISVDVPTADLPELEPGENNAMSEVGKDEAKDLRVPPTRAANALAKYLGDPAAKDGSLFEPHEFITERHAEIDPGDNPISVNSSFQLEGRPIALHTTDGGAVVIFSLRDEFELTVTGNGTISVPPDSAEAALAGKETGVAISVDRLTEAALYIPPGDADGKLRLLGTAGQIIGASIA